MQTWVGVLIGLFAGFSLAVISIGLMVGAKDADKHFEYCEGCIFIKEKEAV